MRGVERNSNSRNSHSIPPRRINDTMAMWSEELRRVTLFDGEAELTPESRPLWQQNMELRTKFVRYPGPRPDRLHPTHFWFLEHYGLLPYFLQLQAEGIPARVFFSIVSTCRYVTVAKRTEHLELRGLTGQKLVVFPKVVREAFGIPRDAARNEEQGATWPNQVAVRFAEVEELGVRQYFPISQDRNENLISRVQAPKEPAVVPLQIINDYLLCKAGSGPNPSHRYNLPVVSAFLRLTYYQLVNWLVNMLAGGLASAVKEYVRKFSGGPGEAIVMVSWALALMKIIKHNRAPLFESPFNCPEPWEMYADCSGSYEHADVLWGVHSRRTVAKDALPRILRLKPEERIENALQQAQPRKRRAPTLSSAPARETQMAMRPTRTTQTTTEPKVGVMLSPPREVQELSSSSSPEQPPRKEPRVEEPPQQAEGREDDTAISGFEPSDDELPIGILRRDISRLRQEVQRTEPLMVREKKKKNQTPAVQSGPGGNSSAQPPAREQRAAPVTVEEERPDIGPRYTNEEVRRFHPELFVQLGPTPPTAGVPQPIPVEKTLLDRLAEISRPEAMSGTAEEDQAIRDVVRDPDLPCIVPRETSEASMAPYSEQMVVVVRHWTMEKADGRTNALTSVRPSFVTLAKFFLNQIPQVPGLTIPAPAIDRIDKLQVLCTVVASWAGDLKQEVAEDRRTRSVLTERANGAQAERDSARTVLPTTGRKRPKKRVQERDEELRQAQDELRQAREELAQTRADGKKQSRALEEELRRVRNDVVQREEETGR
ncbi:hypothetical protein R1flu_013269 [Riccia fluitans]|uniref:Aminotransferase-like plant mobile domain-containing protein n=1 Tax=Riccia fluitans TaxID=41844 RepID=A0ABD1YD27_9MARC